MRIEFIECNENNEDSYEFDKYWLSIDGEIDKKSVLFSRDLSIRDTRTLQKLATLSISILKEHFDEIKFTLEQSVTQWEANVKLDFSSSYYNIELDEPVTEVYDPFRVEVLTRLDVRNWNKEYTIGFLENKYKVVIENSASLEYLEDESFESHGVGGFRLKNLEAFETFGSLIYRIKKEYEAVSEKVKEELPNQSFPELFTTLFEFPEELKTASKQYLIYFAQFLADIGIKANASLNEDANKILFTVIPEDGTEALDKIKAALEIYMNAPGFQNVEVISQDRPKDIALIQWEANIHHLRGQVSLAQATLQAKDATIEALQLSNYILKEELLGSKKIESKPPKENEEKLAGGMVSVRKYDGKFFSIDFPAFIRKLKRKR